MVKRPSYKKVEMTGHVLRKPASNITKEALTGHHYRNMQTRVALDDIATCQLIKNEPKEKKRLK